MDYINEFIKFNPSIGGHFKKHQENHDNDFIETNFNDEFENNFEEPSKISSIGEISRKTLGQAFYNKEVYEEMVERNLLTYNFGPKISTSNNKNKVSFKESMDTLMNTIDETRRDELYSHEKDNCSRDCKKRGCGSVVSMDGLWKLTYKICMWEPKNPNIDHNIKEFIPNVCPEQPLYGNAFCYNHGKMVENFGYPVGLRPFLEKCGANPTAYTKEGKAKVSLFHEFIYLFKKISNFL